MGVLLDVVGNVGRQNEGGQKLIAADVEAAGGHIVYACHVVEEFFFSKAHLLCSFDVSLACVGKSERFAGTVKQGHAYLILNFFDQYAQ